MFNNSGGQLHQKLCGCFCLFFWTLANRVLQMMNLLMPGVQADLTLLVGFLAKRCTERQWQTGGDRPEHKGTCKDTGKKRG